MLNEEAMWEKFQAEVLHWARSYIAKPWRIFPCYTVDQAGHCTCPLGGQCPEKNIGKHPSTQHGYKDASCDPIQIERWFGPGTSPSNISIATGKESGLTVIDIDMGPGKVGCETWRSLIEGHGEPQTLMARTGGGGMHVFFQCSADLKSGSNRLGKHVDVKNDGGYIIAPPSRHRSSGRYEWPNG